MELHGTGGDHHNQHLIYPVIKVRTQLEEKYL